MPHRMKPKRCPAGTPGCDFTPFDHKNMHAQGVSCEDWANRRKEGHRFVEQLALRAAAAIQAKTKPTKEQDFWNV